MVLDINLFRTDKGGEPVKILESERKRFRKSDHVTAILDADESWRKVSELKRLSVMIDTRLESSNENSKKYADIRDQHLRLVGNILHPDVPISDNEGHRYAADQRLGLRFQGIMETFNCFSFHKEHNKLICTDGDTKTTKQYSHVDLVIMVDGFDGERGSEVAGGRGYFLKGPLVFLEQAVLQLALRMLFDRGYTPLYTPFFMRQNAMQAVAQLSQFHEELYKVIGRTEDLSAAADNGDEEVKYLIATSEQPIAAFHKNEWLATNDLPIRYAGISTCFRQEAGSHGRDTRGIFRVHQFEKVEQFCITGPYDDESWSVFHEMIGNAKAYHTAVYVHMLNATMCASTRVICALLENHQSANGIVVPEVLRPWMPAKYKEIIPFVRPAPIDQNKIACGNVNEVATEIGDKLKLNAEADKPTMPPANSAVNSGGKQQTKKGKRKH